MFLHSFLKTTFIIFLQHFHKKSFVIKIDTDFNLNVLLKLFFFSPILANNNLLLKIYCENIMIAFLNFNFSFFILFFPYFFIFFHPYFLLLFFLLFSLFFSPPHTYPSLFSFFFFPLFPFFPYHFL